MATDLTSFFEQTTDGFTISFFDKDQVAVTPDSATYTLVDEDSGDVINDRLNTVITPISSVVTLAFTTDDNSIINSDKSEEVHVLQIKFIYNTDQVGRGKNRFSVQNLAQVS